MSGEGNPDGKKPLLAQFEEELAAFESDPRKDDPGEGFSWPAKIGVTWIDESEVDDNVMGSNTRFPGQDG